jgi:hypothetical protein
VGPLDGVAGFLDGNQVAIAQAQRKFPGLKPISMRLLFALD